MLAGHRIVDVFGHLGDRRAGQIGIQTRDQARRKDRSCHDRIRGWRGCEGVRVRGFLVGFGADKGELARLGRRNDLAGAIRQTR